MKKHIDRKQWIFTLFLLFTFQSYGQEGGIFRIDEQKDKREHVELGEMKATVVIVTSIDNLIIKPNFDTDKCQYSGKDERGNHRYEILIDLSEEKKHRFIVSKKGKSVEGEFGKIFEAGERVYYEIDEVEIPIRFTEKSKDTDFHTVNTEACIEINSEVKDLKIDLDDALKYTIKRSQTSTGTYLASLIIDMSTYQITQTQIKEYTQKLDALEKEKELAESNDRKLEIMENMEMLETKKSNIEDVYSLMSNPTLYVSIPKSNVLSLNVHNLKPKDKRSYSIELQTDTITTYQSDYAQCLGNAQQAENNRKFNSAKGFYQQALSTTNIPANAEATIREKITEMGNCDNMESNARQALLYINELKKKGEDAPLDKIEECYRVALECYQGLDRYRNDAVYKERIQKVQSAIERLAIIIVSGTVVDTKDTSIKVKGVSVYAINTPYTNKMEKKSHGIKIGESDANGKFKVEVKKGSYTGLLFVPEKNEKYDKNAYVSLHEQKHLKTTVKLPH